MARLRHGSSVTPDGEIIDKKRPPRKSLRIVVSGYSNSEAAITGGNDSTVASSKGGSLCISNSRNFVLSADSSTVAGRVEDWRGIPKVEPSRCSPFPPGVPQ
jgi:hypothetical protein